MKKLQVALMGTTLAVALAVSGGSAYAAKGMVTAPAPAAMSGLYVSVFGGAALPTTPVGTYSTDYAWVLPLNGGFVLGGAVGMHLMSNVRGELELSLISHGSTGAMTIDDDTNTTVSGTFSTLYALGNLWYDFDTGGPLTPYLGGGAGFAVVMPNLTNIFDDANDYEYKTAAVAPAAQIGGGIKIKAADNVDIDLGYRAKFVVNASLPESGLFGTTPANHVSYVDQAIQVGVTVALP